MKLKDIVHHIKGDFYVTLPHKGVIKTLKRGACYEPKTYNSETVLAGKDDLPEAYLESEVLIHPWDWQTLLIEVLE